MFFDRFFKKDPSCVDQNMPIVAGLFFILIALDYLVFSLISLGKGEVFFSLVSFTFAGLVVLSYMSLRRGIAIERVYHNSKYAKAPKYPLKTIGAVLLSGVTACSAFLGGYALVPSVLIGGAILTGWYLYYGFDVRDDKIDGFESSKSAKRVLSLLLEANKKIKNIHTLAKSLPYSQTSLLMLEMSRAFKKIVTHVEQEPDDYDTARRYLVSYLGELESMSEIYVKLEGKDRSIEVERDFKELLEDSIEKLNKKYKKLLDDDILELDIKLSVMKQRMKNED